MSSLTSIQIQALVREMDMSVRRHRGLKNTNPSKFYEKVSQENKTLYNEFPNIFIGERNNHHHRIDNILDCRCANRIGRPPEYM